MATKQEQEAFVAAITAKARSAPWPSIEQTQKTSLKERPVRGHVWIGRTIVPTPPKSGLRDILYKVVNQLRRPDHEIPGPEETPLQDVLIEFIGPRAAGDESPDAAKLTNEENLAKIQSNCENDMTIFYVHGGGMYAGSPQEYRAISTKLAKLTKARVAAISYRLSPQNQFPGALLDVLTAYASLLYPPEGSPFSAVSPEKIVFAGDSSGAMLVFNLLKLLLVVSKWPASTIQSGIRFHNCNIALPLPAGLAIVCGWCDPCDSLPSWRFAKHDFLTVLQPPCMPNFPTSPIWPTDPPRETPYARAVTHDHEMFCVAAVRDWSGAPPIWFTCGCEERGIDGNRVVASQAAKSGVVVQWNEYEGMPHEFLMLTPKLPQTAHAFIAWAKACREIVAGKTRTNSATRWMMPEPSPVDLGDPKDLAPFPHDDILQRMKECNATRRIWTGNDNKTKL